MIKPIKKAVLPVAGLGTRFLPVTKVVPKELLPIGSRPSLDYIVEEAALAGITEIILVVSSLKRGVAEYFDSDTMVDLMLSSTGKSALLDDLYRKFQGLRFRFALQDSPKGLGHAVLCARELVGDESFLVMLPDDLIYTGSGPSVSRQLISRYEASQGESVLALLPVTPEQVSAYGIIAGDRMSDDDYRVTHMVEKPAREKAPTGLAVVGRYVLSPQVFEALATIKPGALGELQLTDALVCLAEAGTLRGTLFEGRRFDIGVPAGLVEANMFYFKDHPLVQAMAREIVGTA